MNNIQRILDALRQLNDLEVPPLAPWAAALSPGERNLCAAQAREGIPTAILGHHDRMAARGKRSLAKVQNGVCGACHLRLPTGHRSHQTEFEEMDVCDNCGVFLEWGNSQSSNQETPTDSKNSFALKTNIAPTLPPSTAVSRATRRASGTKARAQRRPAVKSLATPAKGK